MTVVSVTFSVMVVALTVSSQHFGPRLLNSFMRDNASQLVLGTFTGTFAYCLVVLRTVQGAGEEYSVFVPHLAVTGALALALLSIAMLIYYVHHIAVAMQVSTITADVAADLEKTVCRLYPAPLGEPAGPPQQPPPPVPEGAFAIRVPWSGYLQEIDSEAVLRLAKAHDTVEWLLARPGDFVIEGQAIAASHPAPRGPEALGDGLCGACIVGTDRTSFQDAAFAVQQLVEVALRALSPGVNEPFTAITCIDRLGQGLAKLAVRMIPSAVRADEEGRMRVVARPYTFVELVDAAFEPIARYAGENPAIHERLFQTLESLARMARRPEDLAALDRVSDFVSTSAANHVQDARHRAELARRHRAVRLLAHRPDRGPDIRAS
jgi:uncharacterized membrane protein